MSKVLVTGAGGFIGSHLAAALADDGEDVVALDVDLERLRRRRQAASMELLEGDVADPELQRRALAGAGVVYHLAAAHLGATVPEAEFRRVNVEALRTLLENAAVAGVRRFVHTSSVGVYGKIEHPPADEDTPCRPDHPYERTKLEGEEVVLEAARQGLPAVVLRPVWVYGPGCGRTEKLFRALAKGRFVVAGRGDALRHCVYIRDMIAAYRLAAAAEPAVGQVIVVGDSAAVPVRVLLAEIASLVGARPPRSVPLALMRLVAWKVELAFKVLGREPPISRRTLKFFTANTAFDIRRAKRLLGYEPRYDLRAGLAETWRELGAKGDGRQEQQGVR